MFKVRTGLRLVIGVSFVAASSLGALAQPRLSGGPASEKPVEVYEKVAENFQITVDVPTINAVGANVDTDTLKALFNGDIAGHAEELRHLTAKSITVPTVTLSYTIPSAMGDEPVSVTAVYNDIVISDVNDGVAARASIASVDLTEYDIDITYGRMSASAVDIGAMLAFYGLVNADPAAGWRTLYRDMQMAGATVEGEDVNCTIGRIVSQQAEARPLKVSIFEAFDAVGASASAKDEDLDPAAAAELFSFLGDMATAIKTAPVISDGFDCAFVDHGEAVDVSATGIRVGAYEADAVYPEIEVDGIAVSADDGSASIGAIVLKPIDYSGPLAALNTAKGAIDDDWFEDHARELIPAFHGLSVADIAFDVPAPEEEDVRILGSIGAFDLSLDAYRNAIPTAVASGLDKLVIEIPEDSTEPSFAELKAMGLTNLTLGYDFSASWDEATETVTFDTVTFDADSLGSIGLSLLLGNATKDLFNSDEDIALAAGMGVTFKSLGLDVIDNGLGAFIYAKTAEEQGIQPEDVRAMLSGMSQGMILGFLGANPAAPDLATAIGGLINAGTPLSATIDAVDPAGISLDALEVLESNPTAIGDMVSVTVNESGE